MALLVSLVKLLAISGFHASRWLVNKLMKQEGLISRQLPTHQYAKTRKITYRFPMCSTETLAVVLDLYARKVIGWTISSSPDSELTKKSL